MFKKIIFLCLFTLVSCTTLQAQKPSFPSQDWFYFGVSAGGSWDLFYDWSFSWSDPADVDKIGQGVSANLGLVWGKEYANGFVWGIEYTYAYGFVKGKYNTVSSKIAPGDDLRAQTHRVVYSMAGMIFLNSYNPDYIPAITLGVDLGLTIHTLSKGDDCVDIGVSPLLGLRGGVSFIIDQDYQIDLLIKAPIASLVSHNFGASIGFKKLFW